MNNKIIHGAHLADELLDTLKDKVALLKQQNIIPCLAVILVGEVEASSIYVRNKIKVATKLGIQTQLIKLTEDSSQTELHQEIHKLNDDRNIHGILVQLPLPKHINKDDIIEAIDPAKDVDGFHPVNSGYLHNGINRGFVPCTPLGCLHLIKSVIPDLNGKNAVVIGRSNIVGRPLSALLNNHNATVTLCHSHTKNLPEITRKADIAVTAIGEAKKFGAEYFSSKTVVIDVGINSINGHLYGDIDFDTVEPIVTAITPVPGGVGPMTIAYLMHNTILAASKVK